MSSKHHKKNSDHHHRHHSDESKNVDKIFKDESDKSSPNLRVASPPLFGCRSSGITTHLVASPSPKAKSLNKLRVEARPFDEYLIDISPPDLPEGKFPKAVGSSSIGKEKSAS